MSKHMLPKFSVPMPGAKVEWPFTTPAITCDHAAARRFFIAGIGWVCGPCKALHDSPLPMVAVPR